VLPRHGDLQLLNPMSLCFLEGVEYGIGILLGKKPEKWPGCWDLGLNLKTLVALEAWQCPSTKRNKNNQIATIRGLRCNTMLCCAVLCCVVLGDGVTI